MALSKIETQALDVGQIGGRRNLIINGAMQVAQRGTSSTATNFGSVDRFRPVVGDMSQLAITHSQSTDAPDGFGYSFKVLVDTPETSLGADARFTLLQNIESQNLQHLQFGTSGAKSLTLSFWVKSSITGTYSVLLYENDATRGRNVTYTVDTADTWEFKTITVEGDTSGTINNDNTSGLSLYWGLSGGSNYTGTELTSWSAYTAVSLLGGHTTHTFATTDAAEFYITGVQLEVGSVATPFEHRSYGEELALCQRYFYGMKPSTGTSVWPATNENSANGMYAIINFPVTMRSAPSVAYNGTITGTGNFRVNWVYSGSATISNFFGSYQSSPDSITIYGDKSNSVYGTGYAVGFEVSSGLDGYFGMSAEL
jgi:hypothetical protein